MRSFLLSLLFLFLFLFLLLMSCIPIIPSSYRPPPPLHTNDILNRLTQAPPPRRAACHQEKKSYIHLLLAC